MKEINKNDFWNYINQKDVSISSEGSYPYTNVFILRHSTEVIGKIIKSRTYPITKKYFIK